MGQILNKGQEGQAGWDKIPPFAIYLFEGSRDPLTAHSKATDKYMKDLHLLLRESLVASLRAEKSFCERHTRLLTCETAFVCQSHRFGPLGQAPVSTNGGQGGPVLGSNGEFS